MSDHDFRSERCWWPFALALLASAGATAQVQNVQYAGATATQAIVSFDVPDPSNCVVQVSTDSSFSTLANDTNPILFPGSGNCNRSSSAVSGNHVVFVAGTRTSAPGTDGLFHSLALQANQRYYYRIVSQNTDFFTCDPNQNCIQTASPPLGNTFPEPAPFNAQAPYNYAWPTIRPGVDRNAWFVDPLTGIPVSMFSAPTPVNNNGFVVANAPALIAFDAAGHGNWAPSGAQAANSAANQDSLFIRMSPWCVAAGPTFVSPPGSVRACTVGQSGWTQIGTDETYFNTVDDIQVQVSASCTGATSGYQFAITVDGVNAATDWQTQSCTGTLTPTTYPATGSASGGVISAPGFPSTQYGTGANATPFGFWFANPVDNRLTRPDLQPHTGVVTVDGSGNVAWQSGEKFRVTSASAGSFLTLVVSGTNTDFRITAVNSPSSLVIASPPAAGTYNYIYQQFGILVRKASAVPGVLTVENASFSDFESAANQMPISALVDICATYTITDGSGAVLRPCMILEGFQHPIYLIDESSGKSRYIGLAEQSSGCATNTCAPGVINSQNNYGRPGIGDAFGQTFLQVQNHWLLTATDSGGNLVAIDGSYNPSGSGHCPNGWREITLANCPTYPYNDNMSYFNATPKVGADGSDHTPVTQAVNYATAHSLAVFDPTRFTTFSAGDPTDIVTGWVEVLFSPGLQDFPGWFAKFDPAQSYKIVAMGNTYSSYNCRFCKDHGSGSLAGFEGISNGATLPVCSGVGCGPMVLQSNTSTDSATQSVCAGITDPNFISFNGQSRCIDLTLAGADPCHTTPNSTEIAPMYGVCSWNSSFAHLSGINVAVGDLLGDNAWVSSGGQSGEMFRVVVIPSPGSIRVIRAYATPAVQLGQFAFISVLTVHAGPWQLQELCSASAGSNGGQSWFNLNVDPTAQNGIVDYPSYITGHGDYWTTGRWIEAGGRYRVYPSIGAMIGAPNSFVASEEGPFAGVAGGGSANYIQSHGAVSRDATRPDYELDSNPYSNTSTATDTLWNQVADNVSGALWHIAAANVQNGGAVWPAAIKSIPFVAWAGGYLLQDVSGPSSSIDGTPGNNWKFCVVLNSGECVSGSSVGDVFLNVPQSGHDGICGPWDYSRNICATLLDHVATSLSYIDFSRVPKGQCGVTSCTTVPGGALFQRLSSLFNRYNFQSAFSSAHTSFGGQWAFGHSDYYGGGLRSDLFIAKLPPQASADTVVRNGFANFPIQVGPSSDAGVTARVRFGYGENGPPTAFYCSYNRKEACITNPTPTTTNPYFFASDPAQSVVNCVNGCVLTVPAIPGRVVYYAVDRLDGSGNLIDAGQVQVGFVP